MLTRRVALSMAALTALATMPVLAGAAPAGASGAVVTPSSRGRDNGDPNGPNRNAKKSQEEPKNCPTEMWTIPLEVKGLACLLLLPKPEKSGDQGGGGGLGSLLGG